MNVEDNFTRLYALAMAAHRLGKARAELRIARERHRAAAAAAFAAHGHLMTNFPDCSSEGGDPNINPAPVSDPCWRVVVVEHYDDRMLPRDQWCEHCRTSDTLRTERNAASRAHGAALRSLDHAYRKAVTP